MQTTPPASTPHIGFGLRRVIAIPMEFKRKFLQHPHIIKILTGKMHRRYDNMQI